NLAVLRTRQGRRLFAIDEKLPDLDMQRVALFLPGDRQATIVIGEGRATDLRPDACVAGVFEIPGAFFVLDVLDGAGPAVRLAFMINAFFVLPAHGFVAWFGDNAAPLAVPAEN